MTPFCLIRSSEVTTVSGKNAAQKAVPPINETCKFTVKDVAVAFMSRGRVSGGNDMVGVAVGAVGLGVRCTVGAGVGLMDGGAITASGLTVTDNATTDNNSVDPRLDAAVKSESVKAPLETTAVSDFDRAE